ncbi:MAG: hypothetical protein Harvfovirus9_22 [Harvfovirus sp.]|uniref:Uncharacterized protein n=1 Tax=Harvfovirus sp. TaxID=2487768 RepID=A0A3G5A128_9VIRU|nr:MAG: hypothetical protein Harvfovirus9_22 [Harvfovirus sp.]
MSSLDDLEILALKAVGRASAAVPSSLPDALKGILALKELARARNLARGHVYEAQLTVDSVQNGKQFTLGEASLEVLINEIIRRLLVAQKLPGITVKPQSPRMTYFESHFDDSLFGLRIGNSIGDSNYAETTLLVRWEAPGGPCSYSPTELKCIGYGAGTKHVADEKELVAELIRLRDFFRTHTMVEIKLTEDLLEAKEEMMDPRLHTKIPPDCFLSETGILLDGEKVVKFLRDENAVVEAKWLPDKQQLVIVVDTATPIADLTRDNEWVSRGVSQGWLVIRPVLNL